jgi:hypothetical protein
MMPTMLDHRETTTLLTINPIGLSDVCNITKWGSADYEPGSFLLKEINLSEPKVFFMVRTTKKSSSATLQTR